MPVKLKPGKKAGNYTIVKLLNVGALAISYEATSASGERVFLKQYKSPTITVDWYRAYVDYQDEVKRRVESGLAKNFCYRFIDFFEAPAGPPTYFQVFEFIDDSEDMEQILERIIANPSTISFAQRLTYAKVMMAGVGALHDAGVIHCDLKPPNFQMVRDPSITAGYRLKLIDMDYSILPDRQAPWHGKQGYVGTPMYYSPEHLTATVPSSASDVFTCGIILYQLLAGRHPFIEHDDVDEYRNAIVADTAPEASLIGTMPAPANDEDVVEILGLCLATNPDDRPAARQVANVLNGKISLAGTRGGGKNKMLVLSGGSQQLRLNVETALGKYAWAPAGDEAKRFLDECQCTITRNDAGQWTVVPNTSAPNETMVDGKAVTEPAVLQEGMELAVGREAKGIVKIPMIVAFE